MDIWEKVRANEYETKLPFGPDKEAKKAYREDSYRLQALFKSDAIAYSINRGIPEKYAAKAVDFAWSEGHSSGYHEILNYLEMIVEIFT